MRAPPGLDTRTGPPDRTADPGEAGAGPGCCRKPERRRHSRGEEVRRARCWCAAPGAAIAAQRGAGGTPARAFPRNRSGNGPVAEEPRRARSSCGAAGVHSAGETAFAESRSVQLRCPRRRSHRQRKESAAGRPAGRAVFSGSPAARRRSSIPRTTARRRGFSSSKAARFFPIQPGKIELFGAASIQSRPDDGGLSAVAGSFQSAAAAIHPPDDGAAPVLPSTSAARFLPIRAGTPSGPSGGDPRRWLPAIHPARTTPDRRRSPDHPRARRRSSIRRTTTRRRGSPPGGAARRHPPPTPGGTISRHRDDGSAASVSSSLVVSLLCRTVKL